MAREADVLAIRGFDYDHDPVIGMREVPAGERDVASLERGEHGVSDTQRVIDRELVIRVVRGDAAAISERAVRVLIPKVRTSNHRPARVSGAPAIVRIHPVLRLHEERWIR